MNATLPLQKLYQRHGLKLGVITPLDQLVCSSFDKTHCECTSIDCVVSNLMEGDQYSPWDQVEKWREMLALALLTKLDGTLEPIKMPLADKCLRLMKNLYWEEFQLESILRSLCAYFFGLPYTTSSPQQFPSGAIPLECGSHWPWAGVPHSLFHAEIGVLWNVFGHLSKDQTFIQASRKAAEWQLNTLDHHGSPFKGLYIQEQDASSIDLLIFDYLLFWANGVEFVAQKLLHELENAADKGAINIPAYAVVLEAWIGFQNKITPLPHTTLPAAIYDPHISLTGYRSSECSVALTLSGGGTGMGALHREDVQLVSYGPQHLPLGDCQGFGIENSKVHHAYAVATEEKLELRNTVRIVSKPINQSSKALFRNGRHSGLWIDATQSFSNGKLNIETTFLGLNLLENIAFVFFANASLCHVDDLLKVRPRSFERYQGKILPIRLEGKQPATALTIHVKGPAQEMSVIPLGGGKNFWGADFLIAYLLNPKHHRYAWQINL